MVERGLLALVRLATAVQVMVAAVVLEQMVFMLLQQ
jgi:uncharacterized membrane protein YidH (DUF202 family)